MSALSLDSPLSNLTQCNEEQVELQTAPCIETSVMAAIPVTPKLTNNKLIKQKSMHDLLLSQSASKYLHQHKMPVSTPLEIVSAESVVTKKAPVSSLMHSLQVFRDGTFLLIRKDIFFLN